MPIINNKLRTEHEFDENDKKTGWMVEVIDTKKKIVKKILFNPQTKEVRVVYLEPRAGRLWRTFSVSKKGSIKVIRTDT